MTTSAHDLTDVRETIRSTRADLAGTAAALAAKVDVKARVKATAVTAASHMKDSTTGVTRRLVRAVSPGEGRRQRAISSRPARIESRGRRRAVADGRPRLADRVRVWFRDRRDRRRGAGRLDHGRFNDRLADDRLEVGGAAGRLGDGW